MDAYNNRKYVCVVYPGVVKNEDKMLETLGGLDNISTVCSKPNRRLELRFRPGDVFCRSACGDRQKAVSFLLKVKVRRKKLAKASEAMSLENTSESNQTTYESIIMGRVETIFNFRALCDFQYLPVDKNETGETEIIYDKVVPKDFPTYEWLCEPAPIFLPPAAFSRMDNMQLYLYRKESKDKKSEHTADNIIGRTRYRRSAHAVFVTFDVPAAPSKPRVSSLKYLELKFLAGEPYTKLCQLFDERPIWSKSALAFKTKFSKDQLKYLVPSVAYYFVTGPFRVMWVRMGYDPRKDHNSRIYQTLDYRIPNRGGLSRFVKPKRRTDSVLPYKSVSSIQTKTVSIIKDSDETTGQESNYNCNDTDVHYIFKPGIKLPARQIFYQYCDIEVPEVEEMFARLPKLPPEAECHRQRGWLPPGFAERVREIITNIVYEDLEKMKTLKTETSEASEEQCMEEDYDYEDDEDVEDDEEDYEEAFTDPGNSEDDSDDANETVTEQTLQNVLNL